MTYAIGDGIGSTFIIISTAYYIIKLHLGEKFFDFLLTSSLGCHYKAYQSKVFVKNGGIHKRIIVGGFIDSIYLDRNFYLFSFDCS